MALVPTSVWNDIVELSAADLPSKITKLFLKSDRKWTLYMRMWPYIGSSKCIVTFETLEAGQPAEFIDVSGIKF